MIFLNKTYKADPKVVFNLFKNGTVFRLTGADEILYDFKKDGLFSLAFNKRGAIHGRFIEISENEIIIEWNVNGFDRPDEVKTIVEITLKQDKIGCLLSLRHINIRNEDAAAAKNMAWKEILDELVHEIK